MIYTYICSDNFTLSGSLLGVSKLGQSVNLFKWKTNVIDKRKENG